MKTFLFQVSYFELDVLSFATSPIPSIGVCSLEQWPPCDPEGKQGQTKGNTEKRGWSFDHAAPETLLTTKAPAHEMIHFLKV